jgi:hypothetical protein
MIIVGSVIVWVIYCAARPVQQYSIWSVLNPQWKMYLKKTGSVASVELIRYAVLNYDVVSVELVAYAAELRFSIFSIWM